METRKATKGEVATGRRYEYRRWVNLFDQVQRDGPTIVTGVDPQQLQSGFYGIAATRGFKAHINRVDGGIMVSLEAK